MAQGHNYRAFGEDETHILVIKISKTKLLTIVPCCPIHIYIIKKKQKQYVYMCVYFYLYLYMCLYMQVCVCVCIFLFFFSPSPFPSPYIPSAPFYHLTSHSSVSFFSFLPSLSDLKSFS